MKSIVVRLLLFFYLTSTYLGATHIHNEALESHGDCKVCIVVKNLNSGDAPNGSFEILGCEGCFEPILYTLDNFVLPLSKGFDAHAPPSLS